MHQASPKFGVLVAVFQIPMEACTGVVATPSHHPHYLKNTQ